MIALLLALAASAGSTALDSISPDSLRANLAYLASDEIEGRATPSRGLDLAADYIAARFREHGLEPAAPEGSYFQTATFAEARINREGFSLTLAAGKQRLAIAPDEARIRTLVPLDLSDSPVTRLPASGAIPPIEGQVVAGDSQRYGTEAFLEELQSRKPAAIILAGESRKPRPATPQPFLDDLSARHAPVIRVNRTEAAALLHGDSPLTVSLHLAAPAVAETALRNVAAVLPGSDPALRDQYVLLTAHYDHLGKTDKGIFHGANDNGSGAVSVIEIAAAIAALPEHPRRSILFLAFFGEEEGLLGSYYYTHHPLVPLRNTIAGINLEQLGRTDEQTGRKVLAFAFTGSSYSNLPALLSDAGKTEGVKTWTNPNGDDFFARSDNYAFALKGVVDTTIAVAFEFRDYHALGDTVEKIDFLNMAKIDRAIAAGVIRIANEAKPPQWSRDKAAAAYREVAPGRPSGTPLVP